MKTVIQGLALEISQKVDKVDKSKVYHTLIVYEFGKQYPDVVRLGVHQTRLMDAQKLPGQLVEVEGEITIFKDRTSVQFVSGKVLESNRKVA